MGNANGRKDPNKIDEGLGFQQQQQLMDAHGVYPQPMLHSPPHSPMAYHSPHLLIPQVPVISLPREIPSPSYGSCSDDMFCEKLRPVMITWSHGGKQVAIEGSWDNWKTREPLQKSGKEFTVMKVLPSGVYHYRFVVDGRFMCAPDLPLDRDDCGNTCNILELQEYIPEALVSMPEFESPPSPESSYSNLPFIEEDFRKPPPELPPHLQMKFTKEPSTSMSSHQSLARPPHVVLNHLFVQSDSGQPVALSSTHRFLQKYVKVVLYKPSQR